MQNYVQREEKKTRLGMPSSWSIVRLLCSIRATEHHTNIMINAFVYCKQLRMSLQDLVNNFRLPTALLKEKDLDTLRIRLDY